MYNLWIQDGLKIVPLLQPVVFNWPKDGLETTDGASERPSLSLPNGTWDQITHILYQMWSVVRQACSSTIVPDCHIR